MPTKVLSFHQFKAAHSYVQITHLNESGISLDVFYYCGNREVVLFAYHNFFIELIVEKQTDEIVDVRCFKASKRLQPYLPQINISEITALLQPR